MNIYSAIKKSIKKILPEILVEKIVFLKREVKLFMYKGDEHSCPYCNKRFSKFFPYKNSYKISNDRERNLYFYFNKKLNFFDKSVLHLAPEKLLYSYISNSGPKEYICGDLSPKLYSFAAGIRKINLLELGFPDGYFDFVICNHILEHIEDDRKAMAEINRVLKPTGIAILLVPIGGKLTATYEDFSKRTEQERAKTFGQWDHVRIYEEKDYIKRLESVNFRVEVMPQLLTKSEISLYGINPREKIYSASKR